MRFCSIASGSSGNCIYVGSEEAHVLVDTGISGKRIEQGLRLLGRQQAVFSLGSGTGCGGVRQCRCRRSAGHRRLAVEHKGDSAHGQADG